MLESTLEFVLEFMLEFMLESTLEFMLETLNKMPNQIEAVVFDDEVISLSLDVVPSLTELKQIIECMLKASRHRVVRS